MAVQPNIRGGHPGGTPKATMAYHHALADTLPSVGFRLLRIGSTVAALPRSIVGALLPATRREGRVIGLVGVVIVLFIVAFTNLMLRELEIRRALRARPMSSSSPAPSPTSSARRCSWSKTSWIRRVTP